MANETSVWQQFIDEKLDMLAKYDKARSHARTQPVQVHHGNVGEAEFREWLAGFLPRKYGVTAGYIRSQNPEDPFQTGHHDVIVYDQLESPVLWIEDNKDKSAEGRWRIIPAEHVLAVFEVKSAFNDRSIKEAAEKLTQLAPLMEKVDSPDDSFPKYLRASAALAIVCFEIRAVDAKDMRPLTTIRELSLSLKRPFYGAVVLRGEGLHPNNTAKIQLTQSDKPIEATSLEGGGLANFTMTASREVALGAHVGAIMMWMDANFSGFAFDILALLKGIYRPGRASSFHGLDFSRFSQSAANAESPDKPK
jgi:hypothetical protein